MNRHAAVRGLHYFDVVAGAVLLVVGLGLFGLARQPHSPWSLTTTSVVGVFAMAVIALATRRSRAYSQPVPWLVGFFAVTAVLAVWVLFWQLNLVWFIAAIGFCVPVLVFALVVRRKPWSASISRQEMFKLIAIAIGVGFGLVVIEAGLRVAPGIFGEEIRQQITADPSQYGVGHPYIGYLHTPGGAEVISGKDFRAVHQMDQVGFRNSWPWPNDPQIVVVGDSVAFGYGVDAKDSWSAIVADGLPGHPLVNLALIGAGPQQYLRVYETFGAKLHPKLLLVGVFAGNDFWDAEAFDQWLRSGVGGHFLVWRDFGRPGPFTLRLSDPAGTLQSFFMRYVYPVLRMSRIYNLGRAVRGGFEGNVIGLPKVVSFKDGAHIELAADWFRSRVALSEPGNRAFQVAADALVQLHSQATAQGTHVLMVLQPSKEEVYLPQLEANVPDITRGLRDVFESHGIDYLDLLPGFRERARAGEQLFFERDGHPNRRGYALDAALILAHLRENAAKYGLVETGVKSAGNLPHR